MSGQSNPYAAYGGTVAVDPAVSAAPSAPNPYAAYGGNFSAIAASVPATPVAPNPSEAPLEAETDWRTPLTTFTQQSDTLPHAVEDVLGNIGAAGLRLFLRPIDSVQSFIAPVIAAMPSYANGPFPMPNPNLIPTADAVRHGITDNPYQTIEAALGQAAVMETLPRVASTVAGAATDAGAAGLRRLAGSGPGVAAKLARAVAEENRGIDLRNADKVAEARQTWQDAQRKATADHQAELLKLKQEYEQRKRLAEKAARAGTIEDSAEYWKQRAADQEKYRKAAEDAQKNHAAKMAEIEKAKTGNLAAENLLEMRRQHEQAYQQATAEHYAKEAAADTRAKAEENAAWTAWRQKIAGKSMDGGQITGPLQKLRLDSPEVDRALNQLEPRGDEVPQESPYAQLREHTAQQRFGKDYESLSPGKQGDVDDLLHQNGYSPDPIAFDPQAGQPIAIDRVQRASSILQRYIRSGRFEGPLLGEMKQVAKVLHDAVTRASTDAGAAKDLNAARASTVTYQEAFGKERRPPTTARTLREQQVNPEAYRERATEERLARARRYDPTLVDSYRRVKVAREALKKLPPEDQLRKSLQQVPTPTGANLPLPPPLQEHPVPRAEKLPLPPILPEPETVPYRAPKLSPKRIISAADLQRANDAAVRAQAAGLGGLLFRWAGIWPAFRILSDLSRGAEVSLKPLALMPAAGAAGMAAEELMAQPAVMEFLTKATRQQIAKIPPDLRGSMPDVVKLARARGVQVSPALTLYAATIQRNQQGDQQGDQR